MKLLKYIIVVVIVLLFATSLFGNYYFYNKAREYKRIAKTGQEISQVNIETATATPAPISSNKCQNELVSADEEAISSWSSFTNSTYKYSLKYPSSWNLQAENMDLVTIKGDESDEQIQIRVAQKAEMGFGDMEIVYTEDKEIDCIEATEVTYDGEGNLTTIVDSFSVEGTNFLIIYSFNDDGSSFVGDLVERFRVIQKTFDIQE